MTSSREAECNNKKPKQNDLLILEDFHLMEVGEKNKPPVYLPPNLPKYSIAMNRFTFLRKKEEDEAGRKSYHLVNTAEKNGKKYHIKHNEKQPIMSELEVACWMLYKLSISEYIPATSYSCYDDKFQLIGIASEDIPGFTCNHDDPLREEDLIIDAVEKDYDYLRNSLLEELTRLSKCLDRPTSGDGIFASIWNCTKYSYNAYCTYSPTAAQVKWRCDQLLTAQPDFSRDNLLKLREMLHARQNHISKKPSTEQYRLENLLLGNCYKYANLLDAVKEHDRVDIPKLEKICKLAPSNEELKKKKDTDKIVIMYNEKQEEISVRDIKNYRTLKGIARGTVASYINAENDYHSQNGAKGGLRIDFDMSEWEFLSQFKKCNFFEWALNGLTELINWNNDLFCFTERDIRNFPNLQDLNFRYWPTKSDLLSKSSQNIAPYIFEHFYEHFYSSENSETFKKLAFHPVFRYHAYQTFLKNILINDDMIKESASLCIRNDVCMPNSNKKILDEFINYKLNRLQKLKKLLLNMPEFKEFVIKNKEDLFEAIKEEYEQDINKYKKEMEEENHQHYRKLIRSMEITRLKKEFNDIIEIMEVNDVNTLNNRSNAI